LLKKAVNLRASKSNGNVNKEVSKQQQQKLLLIKEHANDGSTPFAADTDIAIAYERTSSISKEHPMTASSGVDPSTYLSHESFKFLFTYDYENGSGELYMRVGLAIFAMCTMIDRCMSLIQMVETFSFNKTAIKDCHITFMVSIVAKTFSVVFIFCQSFFIFKYANIVINVGKNSLAVGLMHLVCTNFCVFFRTVVMETVSEIKHHKLGGHRGGKNRHHRRDDDDSSAGHHALTTLIDSIQPLLSSTMFDGHHAVTAAIVQDSTTRSPNNGSTSGLSQHATPVSSNTRWKQLGCINTLAFTTDISQGIQEAQGLLFLIFFI
jgi:hypothetical protein